MLILLVSDVRILNRVHMLYIKHKHKAVVKWGHITLEVSSLIISPTHTKLISYVTQDFT